ncbi:hypothetical protein BGX26_007913, partial [Mortierella sp. AD094]
RLLMRYQGSIKGQNRKKRSAAIVEPLTRQVKEDGINMTPPRRPLDIGEVTVFAPKYSKKRLRMTTL